MSSAGAYLRELRERRGVSLEEIARVTRVARRYLEAIEASRFEELPAPVFTRGFIRSYCQALSEPADEVLARYDNRETGTGGAGAIPRAPSTGATTVEARGRGPVFVSFVLLVVLGVLLFAVTLALQSGREAKIDRRGDPVPTERVLATAPVDPPVEGAISPPIGSPAVGDSASLPAAGAGTAAAPGSLAVSPPSLRPSTGDRPWPAPPSATSTVPAVSERLTSRVTSPYRLVARTTQLTWIRVRTEDGHSSEETIPPGQVREWASNRRFTLSIGNAGGVSLELNGVTLPSLGASGAVIPRLVLPPEEP